MFENQPSIPQKPPEDMLAPVDKTSAPPLSGAATRPPLPPPPGPPIVPGFDEKSGIRPKPFIIGGVVLVLLGLVGFGIWFFFLRAPVESALPENRASVTPPPAPTPPSPPPAPVSVCGNLICETGETTLNCSIDCATPPPPPADTDRDGLTDSREAELGTDQNNSDSDSDGLSDFDEVETYGTDPLNPDTDGDNYTDGSEVQNGYNPKGPGRLLQVP